MDAIKPVIGQALVARDQLRVEMGNQMGLGSDGWASQNPNMLEQQVYGTEPLSTDIDRFTPEQQSKKDVLLGEHMPVNPNHLTPEQRSKADVLVGENSMAGQYVPSKVTPNGALTPEEQSKRSVIVGEGAGAAQYIDDMTQTFGGMSEGLEAVIPNPWRPEGAGSRPDDYAGMGYSEPKVEAGTIESVNSDNSNTINDVVDGIREFYYDKATMSIDEFIKKYPNPTEIMMTWDNLISEYGNENLVKEIEQYKWWQGSLSNTTDESKDSLPEIGKWETQKNGKEDNNDTYNEDREQIVPALESMIKILGEDKNDNVKVYIERLFEDMLNGKDFDTNDWYNSSPHELAFGNKIYQCGFNYDKNIRSELKF